MNDKKRATSDKPSDSLKSCPFCGEKLRRNMRGLLEDTNKECILYGFEIHKKMIPAWNTRKPVDNAVKALEEYKNTCEQAYRIYFDTYYQTVCAGMHNAISIAKEMLTT